MQRLRKYECRHVLERLGADATRSFARCEVGRERSATRQWIRGWLCAVGNCRQSRRRSVCADLTVVQDARGDAILDGAPRLPQAQIQLWLEFRTANRRTSMSRMSAYSAC